MSAYKDGAFLKDPESRGKPAANPMTDPAAMEGMMGMMKGNMAMMIPQTLIMSWINAFFAGFVISEFFPHSCRFRLGVPNHHVAVHGCRVDFTDKAVRSETPIPFDNSV